MKHSWCYEFSSGELSSTSFGIYPPGWWKFSNSFFAVRIALLRYINKKVPQSHGDLMFGDSCIHLKSDTWAWSDKFMWLIQMNCSMRYIQSFEPCLSSNTIIIFKVSQKRRPKSNKKGTYFNSGHPSPRKRSVVSVRLSQPDKLINSKSLQWSLMLFIPTSVIFYKR